MVAMYLARKHTALSYSDIGSYFGGRNHSTVVAAEKKTRQWLEANEELTPGRAARAGARTGRARASATCCGEPFRTPLTGR